MNNSKKIFLTPPTEDTARFFSQLKNTLACAGMEALTVDVKSLTEGNFQERITETINPAHCSIHILGCQSGEFLTTVPLSQLYYEAARKKIQSDPSFRMIIWYPPEMLMVPKDPQQEEFINYIRNGLLQNMVFTTAKNTIQLADDIRALLAYEAKQKFQIKESELFIIFNEIDEDRAKEILDMLGDIIEPIENLNIIQDSETDYSELCSQQIANSKLAVIFFRETADWALPFTQQIWKKVGGASSHTPFLLIGDDEPESNINKKFDAPKVISLIITGELIPLEIKMQYDKVIEGEYQW